MENYFLKLKTKNGQLVIKLDVPPKTFADLKTELSRATNILPSNLHVLSGYPPKKLDLDSETNSLEDNVNSGDTLIVEERLVPESNLSEDIKMKQSVDQLPIDQRCAPESNKNDNTKHIQDHLMGKRKTLQKKKVPADNSCLFTSVGYVLGGNGLV